MTGTIAKLVLDKYFGFIDVVGREGSIFFHRERLDRDLIWDEQLQYRRVEFDLTQTPRGLAAENVRAAR